MAAGVPPTAPPEHEEGGTGQEIMRRKGEHLELALEGAPESAPGPGWADLRLVHEALPELDLEEVDLTVELLGRRLAAPLVIAGMTGGHEQAREINTTLARAAERHGLAMGLGSQRAALERPELEGTYRVAREGAPSAFLIANLGAAQLVAQPGRRALGLEDVRRAVDMVRADALAIHLNFLEESIQPEGDRRSRGCAAAIRSLAAQIEVPVIAKETGAGMSRETALQLAELGVAALDVGGAGGTNFAAIERRRAARQGDARGEGLGETLHDWGIPTAVSVVCAAGAGLPVIATGGVRSGLDAAKALALGAHSAGVGRPLLEAAASGPAAVDAWIGRFLEELRTVLMLTGSRDVGALRARRVVVLGQVRRWLDDLGCEPQPRPPGPKRPPSGPPGPLPGAPE
jgi:isopentenyl-diphosphate Delta-isomerase